MRGHLIHISQPTVVGTAPHRQWSKPKSASQQHHPRYPSPYMVFKKQLSFSRSGGSDRQYLSKVRFRIWTKILPKQQGNESIMWEMHNQFYWKYFTTPFNSQALLSLSNMTRFLSEEKENLHTQHQSASAFKRPQRGSVSQHFPILVRALRKINTNHRHNKYKDFRSIRVNASFWFK